MQTVDLNTRTQPKDGRAPRQADSGREATPSGGARGGRRQGDCWWCLGADAGADGAELARGALAEEGDGHDADDGDQGDQQGVLNEAGAPLVGAELGSQVGQAELPGIDDGHFELNVL